MGYTSSTQPVRATRLKQSMVMSLNNDFSKMSVTNARSSAPDKWFSPAHATNAKSTALFEK